MRVEKAVNCHRDICWRGDEVSNFNSNSLQITSQGSMLKLSSYWAPKSPAKFWSLPHPVMGWSWKRDASADKMSYRKYPSVLPLRCFEESIHGRRRRTTAIKIARTEPKGEDKGRKRAQEWQNPFGVIYVRDRFGRPETTETMQGNECLIRGLHQPCIWVDKKKGLMSTNKRWWNHCSFCWSMTRISDQGDAIWKRTIFALLDYYHS